MSSLIRLEHTYKVEAGAINNVDPDDGNRWKCKACLLPIFATPVIVCDVDSSGHMHDQCANKIPLKFKDHPSHPMADLILQDVHDLKGNSNTCCSRCKSKCGSKFYKCLDDDYWKYCGFTLDLSCALPITIFHQSHWHGLTATRGSSCSFICSACGTQHQPPLGLKNRNEQLPWGVSYMCSVCDFWIHPDCAVLPSAIIVDKVIHEHPLLLSYEDVSPMGRFWGRTHSDVCAICEGRSEGLGWYKCFHCSYSAHIKCIVYADPPHTFEQVLLRDAQVPGLIHLPMADEHQSVMQRIMKITSSSNNDGDHGSKYFEVHKHPLIFHDGDGIARVCNACVKLISPSDPFYSCSSREYEEVSCRDFFLHSFCVHLPSTITRRHWDEEHKLSLLLKVDKYPFNLFRQYERTLSRRLYNGFSYFCEECRVNMDVVSVLMPASITHDAHAKSHILNKTTDGGRTRSCCNKGFVGLWEFVYECNNCYNFSIHAECALLPDTVRHEFDRHPLKLITNTPTSLDRQEEEEDIPFCEICEENMETGRWFYGCKKCDQSFHIQCIPYFDDLSGIKFGFTVGVTCHDCPLACVRALSVDGYRCGHCDDVIRKSHKIAFECAQCDYRIHGKCAQQLELKG